MAANDSLVPVTDDELRKIERELLFREAAPIIRRLVKSLKAERARTERYENAILSYALDCRARTLPNRPLPVPAYTPQFAAVVDECMTSRGGR